MTEIYISYLYIHIYIYIRPVEMKNNILGGATNYEILPTTMVCRRRKFFISNRLKGLMFNVLYILPVITMFLPNAQII